MSLPTTTELPPEESATDIYDRITLALSAGHGLAMTLHDSTWDQDKDTAHSYLNFGLQFERLSELTEKLFHLAVISPATDKNEVAQ